MSWALYIEEDAYLCDRFIEVRHAVCGLAKQSSSVAETAIYNASQWVNTHRVGQQGNDYLGAA